MKKYVLKLELEDTNIWRRVSFTSGIGFYDLHSIIQIHLLVFYFLERMKPFYRCYLITKRMLYAELKKLTDMTIEMLFVVI